MRGRSLRLDPADPDKIASNWDIVCVAPELERGVADYPRFVRRHTHLHAPCEDGSIESGVSHVHPELSPFAPPPVEDFAELNAAALARAADRERRAALADRGALPRRRAARAARAPAPIAAPRARARRRSAACARRRGPAGGCCRAPAAAASPSVLPLERAARAVADALRALGELSDEAHASLAWQPRAGGYVRCLLPAGDEQRERRASSPRSRTPSRPPAITATSSHARSAAALAPLRHRWHPVPRPRPQPRARPAYRAAFTRWLGPGELRYTPSSEASLPLALARAASLERSPPLWL